MTANGYSSQNEEKKLATKLDVKSLAQPKTFKDPVPEENEDAKKKKKKKRAEAGKVSSAGASKTPKDKEEKDKEKGKREQGKYKKKGSKKKKDDEVSGASPNRHRKADKRTYQLIYTYITQN